MSNSSQPSFDSGILAAAWASYLQKRSQGVVDVSACLREEPESIHGDLRLMITAHEELNLGRMSHHTSEPPLQLQPGQMIDDVEIQGLLGSGGMGEVYLGFDTRLHRYVAVKVMQWNRDQKSLATEIAAMVRLDHPRIVKIFRSATLDDSTSCAMMEFVDGGQGKGCSLRELLDQRQSQSNPSSTERGDPHFSIDSPLGLPQDFTPQFVAGWLAPVAQALAYAHQSGAIHRDIKPANLLLKAVKGEPPLLMIGDWGLSKLAQQGVYSTVSRQGTPEYWAPEITDPILQPMIDHRCDIFSFGVTLFETRAQQRPQFDLHIPFEQCQPSITSSNADFDLVCRLCLEPDPRNRYSDMEIVAAELERIHRGERIVSRPTSWLRRQWWKVYDSKRWWLIVSSLVLLCLVILYFANVGWQRYLSVQRQRKVDQAAGLSVTALTPPDRPEIAALKAAHAYDVARDIDSRQAVLALERFNSVRRNCPITVHAFSWPEQLVEQMQFDPSGHFLGARNQAGEWRIWGLETDQVLTDLGDSSPLTACVWPPDGRRAYGFQSGTVVVQWPDPNVPTSRFHVDQTPTCLALHPTEGRLTVATQNSASHTAPLVEWNVSTEQFTPIILHGMGTITHVEYSPDGSQLLIRDNLGRVQLRSSDPSSKQTIVQCHHRPNVWLPSHFRDHGRQFVVVQANSQAAVYETRAGKVVATLSAPHEILSIAVGPLSGQIVMAGFDWAMSWPAVDRPGIVIDPGHDIDVTSLSWTPDERVLLSAAADGTVRGWNPHRPLATDLSLELSRSKLVVSDSDGRSFATFQEGGVIRVWDYPEPTQEQFPFAGLSFIATSDDGNYFAPSGSHRGQQRSSKVRVRKVSLATEDLPELPVAGVLRGVTFRRPTRDEVWLLSEDPHQLEVYNFLTGVRRLDPIALDEAPVGAAYSPDGQVLAVCTEHGQVLLLDGQTGAIRHRLDQGGRVMRHMFLPHTWIAFSPDGNRFATWGMSSQVSVWRTVDGQRAAVFELPPKEVCVSATFSPDGQFLATAAFGQRDEGLSQATIWDLAQQRAQATFAHPDWVYSVEFSRDQTHLLTACRDHKARLWSIQTGLPVQSYDHNHEVYDARFVPRPAVPNTWPAGVLSEVVVTASRDNTLGIWDSTSGERISAPLKTERWPFQIAVSPQHQSILVAGQATDIQLIRLQSSDDVLPEHLSQATLGEFAQALVDEASPVRPDQNPDSGQVAAVREASVPSAVREYARRGSSMAHRQQWHATMARTAIRVQDWEGAIFHLELTPPARERNALVEALRSRLGQQNPCVAWRAEALQATRQQTWSLAEELLHQVFDHGSPTMVDYELRSLIWLYRQKFAEALADCNQAIALGAGTALRVRRAHCLTYLGQRDLAIQELNLLVQQHPHDQVPLFERGEVHGSMRHWTECQHDFRRMIERFDERGHGRMGYAIACAAAGDAEAFAQAARDYLAANRNQATPHRIMSCAIVYAQCGPLPRADQEQMLAHFQKTWVSDDYYSQLVPGMLLYRLGQIDAAIPLLETALQRQLHGGTPFELSYLAMCRVQQGRLGPARELVEQAQAALVRLSGPYQRVLSEIDVRNAEPGVAISWYHIEMYRLCIQEAERKLAAAMED